MKTRLGAVYSLAPCLEYFSKADLQTLNPYAKT